MIWNTHVRNTLPSFKSISALVLLWSYSIQLPKSSDGRLQPGQIPLTIVNDKLFDQKFHITTTSGVFTGIASHLTTSRPINAWLGIPYAEKPVGALRFKAPVPLTNRRQKSDDGDEEEEAQTAWEFGDACPQAASHDIPVPISEDCLSLNIYRPASEKTSQGYAVPDAEDENKLLPVLVWIHGGGLSYGSSAEYDGSGKLHV